MARIKTYYDYEIKKEAFEVLGDVGYTKSTDITLTPIAFSNSMIEYGVQTFTVDVVGEKGVSEIIIYDNDSPIPVTIDGTEMDMITWSNENEILTFTVNLNYDVEHNIRAMFKGNDKCLGSKSRLITINEPTPDAYSSTLRRYNDSTVDYTPNTAFTLPIEFVSGQPLVNSETKTLEWFIDNVSQGTTNITILANADRGNTPLEIGGLSKGSHSIRINFEGDEHSGATELTFEISVGYVLEITSRPTFLINNQNLSVSGRVTNYLGTPINGIEIFVMEEYGDWQYSSTTNANGEATVVCNSAEWDNITGSFDLIYYVFQDEYDTRYSTQIIRNVTVNLTADTLITATDRQSSLTATVTGTTNPIPVTFSGGITGTYTTSEEGLVVKQYTGSGVGDVTVTASINGSSSSVTIEDLLQYWRANNVSYNQSYSIQTGTLQELNNGYKLPAGSAISINQDLSEDFELTFSIVQGNSVYNEKSSTGSGTTTKKVTYNNIPMTFLLPYEVTVATGDVIKFTNQNGEFTLYKNNTVVWTYSMSLEASLFPISTVTPTSSPNKTFVSGYVLFNNLKIKRL